MSLFTVLAISQVRAQDYAFVVKPDVSTMDGSADAMYFSKPFQSSRSAWQSTMSISTSGSSRSTYDARINNADGGGRYSPMTNQEVRSGSTNNIFDFICLFSGNRESIEIDFHLLKVTRNLEKKKRRGGIRRTSTHLIPSMHENKIRCFIMVLVLSVD